MKKKILMLAVAACLIVLSIASSSLAYFTDTDAETKVFTAGNVYIDLVYTTDRDTTKNLYPGQSFTEEKATIQNTGSEQAYVGAIITFEPGIDGVDDDAKIDKIKKMFPDLTSAVYNFKTNTDGSFSVYVVFTDALAVGSTVTIFDDMTIPETWGNDDMLAFNSGLDMTITAYATQTVFNTDIGAADALVTKSCANIPGVKTSVCDTINVYDILNADKFIATKAAIEKIEEVYA